MQSTVMRVRYGAGVPSPQYLGVSVEEREAKEAVTATLCPGESVLALGYGRNVATPYIKFADHDASVWLAFTEFRYIEIPFANRSVFSFPLAQMSRLELRKGVRSPKLLVNATGAPDDFGLSRLEVSRSFARTIQPYVDARLQAHQVPSGTTKYRVVKVMPLDPAVAALMGGETTEFHCVKCGGGCGVDTTGSVLGSGGPQVNDRCSGCLRRVEGPVL